MIRRRIKQRLGHTGRLAPAHSLDLLQLILGEMSDAASLGELLERTVSSLHTALGNTATAALQLLPDDASLDCLFLRSAQAYHGSRELPITLRPGEIVRVECRPNANPLLALLYITLWRNDYIALKTVNSWT